MDENLKFFEHLNILSIGDSMISIVIRFNKLIRKKFSNQQLKDCETMEQHRVKENKRIFVSCLVKK